MAVNVKIDNINKGNDIAIAILILLICSIAPIRRKIIAVKNRAQNITPIDIQIVNIAFFILFKFKLIRPFFLIPYCTH